jgi:CTP-dependent riboflavin kinase
MNDADTLVLTGSIVSGKGHHSKITIPGRSSLPRAPDDWPETLHPGSLNVRIDDRFGLPKPLAKCPGEFIDKLDSRMFRPAFEIPFDSIRNNDLKPTPKKPRRGDAQVWRASLFLVPRQLRIECWVLRRFWSSIKKQLEIVSDKHRRKEFQLADGAYVVVDLYGTWITT